MNEGLTFGDFFNQSSEAGINISTSVGEIHSRNEQGEIGDLGYFIELMADRVDENYKDIDGLASFLEKIQQYFKNQYPIFKDLKGSYKDYGRGNFIGELFVGYVPDPGMESRPDKTPQWGWVVTWGKKPDED